MSNRREIEDRYTVTCRKCKAAWVNPDKHPRQKWGDCPDCVRKENMRVSCPDCGKGWIKADREKGQIYSLCPRCRVTKPEYNRKVL